MAIDRKWVNFEWRAELRAWLGHNHASSAGVWAVYPKSSTGESDLSWDALVAECLCVGWIDSLPGKVDDRRTRTYISPRKPRTGWSRRNKGIVERLLAEGLMLPAGRASVDQAKADGTKRALLQWVYTARREETQRKRSEAIAVAAAAGVRSKGF